MQATTAFRLSWTPILSGVFAFYLPIVWIGYDPVWVYGMVSGSLAYQFFVHTELAPRVGWLEWVINTPSAHRVHHASNPEYIDKNFGGSCSFGIIYLARIRPSDVTSRSATAWRTSVRCRTIHS